MKKENNFMKLTVFGATDKTGLEIVKQAIRCWFENRALCNVFVLGRYPPTSDMHS
jgi:hypothetical protein